MTDPMTDRELAGCACPTCGAPVSVERVPMFSADEAMASGVPDDSVERYTYSRAPSRDAEWREYVDKFVGDAALGELRRRFEAAEGENHG